MSILRHALITIAILAPTAAEASPEICGNDIDDDGNGLTDEGCYPSLTTGVCESPLSCGDTGMVSWTTGSLHYDLAPDIAPAVPYGPGIGFRRFYTPSYSPAGLTFGSVNEQPLGPGWQHTYMTWLDAYTVGPTNYIVLHTSQGRDVLYTETGACGSDTCYSPQAGDHVMSLKYDPTNLVYYVQLLTGETLKYNAVGQIIEIWDNLQPTPNKVLITWTGTTDGNVSTVTDASGQRQLSFTYTNNLLTSLAFQINTSTGWVTQHTTTYDYSLGLTRDATSGWYVPASSSEWSTLLTGSGIANPTNAWGCQDTSGSLTSISGLGSVSLTAHGAGGSYNQSVSGWSRKAVKLADGGTSYWQSASSICNPATTSCTVLGLIGMTATPAAERDIITAGDGNGMRGTVHDVTGPPARIWAAERWNTSHTINVTNITNVKSWIMTTDHTSYTNLTMDGVSVGTPTWATGTSANGNLTIGAVSLDSAGSEYLYLAEWNGTALTTAEEATLHQRIANGPGILTSVTIGGQLAQQYSYASSGYLATIKDGAGVPVASFTFSAVTPEQVVQISTPRGTVGFEYGTSRTGCTAGDSVLYFNLGNTNTCSTDTDCSAGFLCGGQTGATGVPGGTGRCFLAARCMTTSTANGESVITNIATVGGGTGGTCSGACSDVMQYSWSTASGLVNVIGREDPQSDFTSATYNANGLPTQTGYGDTDNNPTNGGTNRTAFYFYDTTFPGRLAEVRRPSDVSSSSGSCSATNTTGCERTLYTYDSTSQQLKTIEQDGYTLTSTGTTTTYSRIITYTHDSAGRISEIDGAVSGIKTTFDYYPSSTTTYLTSNFLEDDKTYSDATHFLEPKVISYDFFGHPTGLQAPDGNLTCDTYDTARGQLTQRRKAMVGQTDCTTTNSADLITNWTRDSWLRLTSLQRPDQGCVLYAYTSGGSPNNSGQLYNVMRRDDCNSGSVGESQRYVYTTDGQVSEVDTYSDDFKTEIAIEPYTYFASRRLQSIVNPVDTTKFTGLKYDSAGRLTEVDGAASLSEVIYNFVGALGRDGRVSSVNLYKTSTTYDTWSLLYAWLGEPSQVTDPDSNVAVTMRDDLGQLVKTTSGDLAGPTIRVLDAAGRLTTLVEDQGGGTSQQTHTFTWDALGRPLNDDYQGACATTGTAHPEIQRTYDALPSGVTCPITGGCNNLSGRLAYVDVILLCSSTYSTTDGSLDQLTYYSYDEAGRLVEEYITDDSGRVADHKYTYTADGALATMTTPSTAVVGWTYGTTSGGNNSDADRIVSMYRGTPTTPIIDTVAWNAFGPWASYRWEAKDAVGSPIAVTATRNKALRISDVLEKSVAGTAIAEVAITEDAMGRVTSRGYTPHDPTLAGLFDSHFLYDEESRVTCETTDSKTTCPTTGSDIKNNHSLSPPFMGAGDWKQVLRPIAGSTGGLTNNFNASGTGYGTTHQITDINQSDGTPAFGHTAMAYDVRGERSYDDNTTTLTNDRRDYTYDGRHNLVNVRGQYYTGTTWHYYDVASAFDLKDRRVFKSFYYETTTKTAQWFFYYDALDRLTEVRYTPDISASGTYSVFQLFWLGNKLVLYWQTDNPSATTSKRYVASDESDRPIQLWNWPSSGATTLVWALNPSAFGYSTYILGPSIFQPLGVASQYQDVETAAYENDGVTVHRPGIVFARYASYDITSGSNLQFSDGITPGATSVIASAATIGGNVSVATGGGVYDTSGDGCSDTYIYYMKLGTYDSTDNCKDTTETSAPSLPWRIPTAGGKDNSTSTSSVPWRIRIPTAGGKDDSLPVPPRTAYIPGHCDQSPIYVNAVCQPGRGGQAVCCIGGGPYNGVGVTFNTTDGYPCKNFHDDAIAYHSHLCPPAMLGGPSNSSACGTNPSSVNKMGMMNVQLNPPCGPGDDPSSDDSEADCDRGFTIIDYPCVGFPFDPNGVGGAGLP